MRFTPARVVRRHAVITGASSGIGAALAIELATRGTNLTLVGRNEERLQQTTQHCGSSVRVLSFVCDVTDSERLRSELLAADDILPIDLVIANAGIGGHNVLAPPGGEAPTLVREIFDVNMLGVVNTVAPLIERLRARRTGHIVLVSSLAGYAGVPDAPAYCASKAAVRVYGQGLRRLLAADGIGVTVVCPGFVDTAMSRSLPHGQPFRCSTEEAALRILRAADRGAPEVAFPWQLFWLSRLMSFLPAAAGDLVLSIHRRRSG